MWINPITDRTAGDVVAGTKKGFRNQSDLNRIEINCQHLAWKLAVKIPIKMWGVLDIPTISQINRILNNLSVLKSKKTIFAQVPTQQLNTWQSLNAAELVLLQIYNQIGG